MRVRLVQITVRPGGKQARREDAIEANRVRIGRAPGNEVELDGLAVAMQHGAIESHVDGAYIVPIADNEIIVDGARISDETRLSPGDTIRIGGHELRIGAPTADADVAIEIQRVHLPANELEELRERSHLLVERGRWQRRPWSWAAVLSIFLLAGVLPFATGWRGAWSSGELTRKHSFIANDCGRCHSPFQASPDEKCLTCHTGITSHAKRGHTLAVLETARCASCHLEHNGEGGLAALEEALCASCHIDLSQREPEIAGHLRDASDFQEHHPEFQLHIAIPTHEDKPPEVERVEWSPEVREKSGVKFNHEYHNEELLGWEDDVPSLCNACHQLDAGGNFMRPIEYERHCQECHELSYDESVDVTLAHGNPTEVRRELTKIYLERAFSGAATGAAGQPLFSYMQRDGYSPSNEERREIDRWAQKSVDLAEERLYDASGGDGSCILCHTLKSPGSPGRPPLLDPVAITQRWVPQSEFTHSTHAPFPCAQCHPAAAALARTDSTPEWALPGRVPYGLLSPEELLESAGLEPSSDSSDVLVVGVESCRKCHASAGAQPPEVPSPCVMCHPFHLDGTEPISQRRGDAARARANAARAAAREAEAAAEEAQAAGNAASEG